MLPPFHGERMGRYGDVMDEMTLRDFERWPLGRPSPVMPRMQAITRDVILRAVFGTRAGAREDDLRRRIDDVLVRTPRATTQLAVLAAEAAGLPHTPFHRAARRMD